MKIQPDCISIDFTQFPDSQQSAQAKLNSYSAAGFGEFPGSARITQSISSFTDLEKLCCAVAALRNRGCRRISLFAPYVLGARSDRAFAPNGLNYLRDVLAPIINSLELESVELLDPHSDVLPAVLANSVVRTDVMQWFYGSYTAWLYKKTQGNPPPVWVVAPDAGAAKRAHIAAEALKAAGVIQCLKTRNLSNGNITKLKILAPDVPIGMKDRFVVVDDLCDGGATFLSIAEGLVQLYRTTPLDLVVTHGVFSKGFDKLLESYDSIHVTDSFPAGLQNIPERVNVFRI